MHPLDHHLAFYAKPRVVGLGHLLMLFADEFVSQLIRLGAKYQTVFVGEKGVRQPRAFCQDEVKFLFYFLTSKIFLEEFGKGNISRQASMN
jgi:hypothetical protein